MGATNKAHETFSRNAINKMCLCLFVYFNTQPMFSVDREMIVAILLLSAYRTADDKFLIIGSEEVASNIYITRSDK